MVELNFPSLIISKNSDGSPAFFISNDARQNYASRHLPVAETVGARLVNFS